MIRFLTDWWRPKPDPTPPRHVFHYRVAGELQAVDPLVILRRIESVEPAWETVLGTLAHKIPADADFILRAAAEEKRKAASERIVEIGRSAFEMPPLAKDGAGTTEAEVVGVLVAFVGFLNRAAEDARPFGPAGRAPVPVPTGG